MNVTLIPFFLAANLAPKGPAESGPYLEYTFQTEMDVVVNYSGQMSLMNLTEIRGTLTFPLKCRTKDTNSITCRLTEMTIRSSDRPTEYHPRFTEGEDSPFDVTFSKNGVESLNTQRSAIIIWKNILKNVVELMSVGADLSNITRLPTEFNAVENCVMGEMDTAFNVNLISVDQLPFTIPDNRPITDLNMIPISEGNPGYCMMIEKTRDVVNSDDVNEALEIINTDERKLSITTDVNKMYICGEGYFRSDSLITAKQIVRHKNAKGVARLTEKNTMVLEKIEWSSEEWPAMEDPETTPLRIANFIHDGVFNMMT